jgi:hypothetical protein
MHSLAWLLGDDIKNIGTELMKEAIVAKVPTNIGVTRMCPRSYADESYLVWVDPAKFCTYWANDSKNDWEQFRLATGGVDEWVTDRKYLDADDIMKTGETIIPFSDVSFYLRKETISIKKRFLFFFPISAGTKEIEVPCIRFVDGVTRFIWLMAHQAKHIPVECTSSEVCQLLDRYVGAEGTISTSIKGLVKAANAMENPIEIEPYIMTS